MKEAVAKIWSKGLESGEFKRTKYALRSGDCYCPLGVLCEIYRKETGGGEWLLQATEERFEFMTYADSESSCTILPPLVREWAGIHSAVVSFPPFQNGEKVERDRSMLDINDMLNFEFKKVAPMIRREWKHL